MTAHVGLAEFIDTERVAIVAEWEEFARSLVPAGTSMTPSALRDHADQILTAIVHDMKSQQSEAEQEEKSKGRGKAQRLGEIGKIHALLRIDFGFKCGQMVAEYRALRAIVLRLWESGGTDPQGVTRFNESIDEALTEAVESFMETTEHFTHQSLGILGHDLRTPLAAIIMGATMIIGTETLDAQTIKTTSRVLTCANRMSRMIEDLLDLTRTRFGDRIPVVPMPIDLELLCRQVLAELDGEKPTGKLRLACSGELRGEWDADRIAQVLSNLVSNALQYGAKADPIDVVVRGEADQVVITVHNLGPVISEKSQKSIFEPMIRDSGDAKTNRGLGLGLYIASQVVLAHGGKLDVSSTRKDGTTFTVKLPRSPQPALGMRPVAAAS
jgi:signal transduction histidine kinase